MTTYLPTEEAKEDTLNALNSSFIQQSQEEEAEEGDEQPPAQWLSQIEDL